MLGHPKEAIVKYALSTLHNLLTYMKSEVAGPIRLAGGVTKMSFLLGPKEKRDWSDRFYAILCSCLEMLCMGDIGSKGLVAGSGCFNNLLGHGMLIFFIQNFVRSIFDWMKRFYELHI